MITSYKSLCGRDDDHNAYERPLIGKSCGINYVQCMYMSASTALKIQILTDIFRYH